MHEHRCFYRIPEDERRKWQDPEAILANIGVKPLSVFMDIGCGDGFFTLPAARIVGAMGTVYALDIDAVAIGKLKEKADAEGLHNLTLKIDKAEDTVFCQACADFVFFGIDLHDFADPAKVLANARKMLKPTGKVVDLDWKKEGMEFGPPLAKRFSEERTVRLMETAGFTVESVKEIKPYFYLVIARP